MGAAELLLLTDLGLEDLTVKFIRSFAALNRRRGAAAQHRLIVLDYHASRRALILATSADELASRSKPTLPTSGLPRANRRRTGQC